MNQTMKISKWQHVAKPVEGSTTCFDYFQIDGELTIPCDGFAICFNGEIRVYVNRCPHAGSPLDWEPGQFFSADGKVLVCHIHGAWFDPLSGELIEGPSCPHGLETLPFKEDESLLLIPAEIVTG